MKIAFTEKLQIFLQLALQFIFFLLWHRAVANEGLAVFNNLGISDVWFFPVALFLFLILNLSLAFFIFGRNYFLRFFLLFFNFIISLLEIVILSYYVIVA